MDVIIHPIPNFNLCDKEPIHIPGSIQPRGIMLVVDPVRLRVRYAAGDVEGRLGVVDWLDAPLEALIGSALTARIGAGPEFEAAGDFIGQF
jgi:light-regulated signal transduction histidine kinase (bacteriophytochrome)